MPGIQTCPYLGRPDKRRSSVLGEHNGTKTELYQTNAKCQGLVPAHFALIIIIVVPVVKHQSVINKYMPKAGEPENDAGFFKVIIIAAVHVAS